MWLKMLCVMWLSCYPVHSVQCLYTDIGHCALSVYTWWVHWCVQDFSEGGTKRSCRFLQESCVVKISKNRLILHDIYNLLWKGGTSIPLPQSHPWSVPTRLHLEGKRLAASIPFFEIQPIAAELDITLENILYLYKWKIPCCIFNIVSFCHQ